VDSLTERIAAAARDAGAAIQRVRQGATVEVTSKADSSPVTAADHASNQLLHERLLSIEDAAWLSEESVDDPARLARSRIWIVDPLDGTKEFVEGVPQYAIAIGLVSDGRPIAAVIHNPATGQLFSATAGGGAYLDGQRARVCGGDTMLASRSEMKRGEFASFQDWKLDPVGSIALKLGLIAAGGAAATVSRGPKWEWDVCAGSLIVEEAGGRVTDMFGMPLRFNNPFPKVRGILAGEPAAHARVLERLSEIGASDRMDEFRSQSG
jgi:myo-inositol-1(or 4)-monophosphatase